MARLILVNGMPAAGKSTLARRWAADHPLTLVLDLDVVRGLLGAWAEHDDASGLAARQLGIAMARARLEVGGDVVVPQYLGRLEFVLRLEALAADCGATFVEVALLADADEPAALHRRLRDVLAARPATRTVETVPDDVDATYARLVTALGGA